MGSQYANRNGNGQQQAMQYTNGYNQVSHTQYNAQAQQQQVSAYQQPVSQMNNGNGPMALSPHAQFGYPNTNVNVNNGLQSTLPPNINDMDGLVDFVNGGTEEQQQKNGQVQEAHDPNDALWNMLQKT